MTGELTNEFKLNAAALGNLSAFYFYSYVAMQVPTGLLADHWGPRKLLTLGSFVAAVGTLMFAVAPDIIWASAGRLLIGASVAVAFVALLKLAAHWMPHQQYALASGLALFVGLTGAVFAGVPLRLMIDAYGWRPVMLVSAFITLLVSLLIWLFVRDDPVEKGLKSYHSLSAPVAGQKKSIFSSIGEALRYRNIRYLFLIPGGIVGAILAFGGLWGVPFLTTHYEMPKTRAAAFCSLLLISWAVGGPLFGWLSDHLARRKSIYVLACVALPGLWWLLLMRPGWSELSLAALMAIIGLVSGVMVVSFAFARESAPSRLTGTTSGLINMGVMLGPMLLQPAMGLVLDRYWQGLSNEGMRVYSLEAYHTAFYLLFGWLLLSLILVSLTSETRCKPLYE
ncbi:MAG: MFS transporter [Gammaproteobacteria bacterium]|nr:MFS transporter [Gammaproteobacteria bacterium]